MNKKKHTKAERKRAWDCYVCRLTSPIEIHRPTKEEKEMLKKAGYIILLNRNYIEKISCRSGGLFSCVLVPSKFLLGYNE